MILCRKYFEYAPHFLSSQYQLKFGEDALDFITRHITCGNKISTTWISCSKDFNILKSYATSQTELRPCIAVIHHHNKTELKSIAFSDIAKLFGYGLIDDIQFVRYIRNLKLYEIEKFVIDLSNGHDNFYRLFIDSEMVNNKNGTIKTDRYFREINYTNKDSEVLVLGQIPSCYYKILQPLQYDLLYALLNNQSINAITIDILKIIEQFKINCLSCIYNINMNEDFNGIIKEIFFY